jgi:hypothetical protein
MQKKPPKTRRIDPIRLRLLDAFDQGVRCYFNQELLDGAVQVPQGVPLPGIEMHDIARLMEINESALYEGRGPALVLRCVRELFQDLMNFRTRGPRMVPVFSSGPNLEIGQSNGSQIPIGMWVRAAWARPMAPGVYRLPPFR